MKINPNVEPQGGQGPSATSAAGSTAAAQNIKKQQQVHSAETQSADKTDLSSDAQHFATLSSKAASVPEVRQDRVASLKSAVQGGTYKVSNQQIAQSMAKDFGS